MSTFPYSGKSAFGASSDQNVTDLQSAIGQVQDMLLGMVYPDPNIKLIAHLDNSLDSHLGSSGVASGAVRYWSGKFNNGVLIEGTGANLVTNPSGEVDVTGWSAPDTSVTLSRDTGVFCNQNGITSVASFKIAGSGDAGVGMIKSTVAVTGNQMHSASAYVYAPAGSTSKAKLELAFSGGAPISYNSGDVSLVAGAWTRIRLENVNANNNPTCEMRVILTQQAPAYPLGSRLSSIAASSSASVSDNAMGINQGDVCMCAVSANPSGPKSYAWHMVTNGATGVANAGLRLDDATVVPTFVPGTQFSRLAPAGGDSVPVTDNALVLNQGDLVFANVQGGGYGWHMVTSGAIGVANTALRLDDGPSAPTFLAGSRLTRIGINANAPVTDNVMMLNQGDLVFCRTMSNPTSSGYGWHIVTNGATGVNSPNLHLDGAFNAPTFANGSRLSRKNPTASGTDGDMAANLNTGDFAFTYPLKNPAASGYGWHMVTSGAIGVANSLLRLDQASSELIYADAIQLEQSAVATSYIDSFQGTGFSGAPGSTSSRAASSLSYPTAGLISVGTGSVAFWMYPLWNAGDLNEHVLFDMAAGDEQNRIRLAKDRSNNLVLSVYDSNGGLKQLTTNAQATFTRETWQHVAFTWNTGTLQMFLNGMMLAATPSGTGTGQIATVASSFFLGSDYRGTITEGAVFEDLIVSGGVMAGDQIARIASDTAQFLGVAAARRGFDLAQGNMTTSGTPNAPMTIAHGLGVTPQFIQITERGNGLVYLSSPPDSNNLYVAGSAPSINFDWRALA